MTAAHQGPRPTGAILPHQHLPSRTGLRGAGQVTAPVSCGGIACVRSALKNKLTDDPLVCSPKNQCLPMVCGSRPYQSPGGGSRLWEVRGQTLPSIGTTDGSLIEGEIARFSATAASARRPRALSGGVEESLGRLVRPVRAEAPAKATAASRLRSEGRPEGAGFSKADVVLESLV